MKTIAERLKEAREAAGMTQPELASKAGVSPGTIGNIEAGTRKNPRELLAIAAAVGVRPEWLRDGKEPQRELPELRAAIVSGGDVAVWESPEEVPDDRVWIDRWDYRFSAGEGGIQWEIRQKHALPFSKEFFDAIGSKPKDCKLVMIRGDSMEPFVFNKDMAMIDTSKTRIRDGEHYALLFAEEPLVKQVFTQAGGLTLHSYNEKKYPDKQVPLEAMEHLRVVGEIVYRSGSGFKY